LPGLALKPCGAPDDDWIVLSSGRTSLQSRLIAIVASAGLVLAAGAAAATPSPAAYRSHLNAMCRSYTPLLEKANANAKKAQKANDARGFGIAIGEILGLGLSEDGKVEAAPLPEAMRPQMAPILAQLKTIDVHARLAVSRAAAGDGTGMVAELSKIGRLSSTLDKRYDAAGLRDCGSNQTNQS
jgi:hypothetical protein